MLKVCRNAENLGMQSHSLLPHFRYLAELKTPYRNGTTCVIFEPVDFVGKLAALVLSPCANLTRLHGVFAQNSRYRARVLPGRRSGVGGPTSPEEEPTPGERSASMTCAGLIGTFVSPFLMRSAWGMLTVGEKTIPRICSYANAWIWLGWAEAGAEPRRVGRLPQVQLSRGQQSRRN